MHRSIGLFVFATITAFLLTIMLVPAQSASAFNAFFDFNAYAVGTSAEGIAAPGIKMSSPAAPNGWRVMPASPFQSLSGNVLRSEVCDSKLVINLDSYYNKLDLRFGVSNGATQLRIQGYIGSPETGTQVFSMDYEGFKSIDNLYEGTASEDIQGVNTLVIFGRGGCAAIDDLMLNDTPVIMIPGEILVTGSRLPIPQPLPGPITIEPIIVQPVVIRGN
jgi:hypothetical protein